MCWGGRKDRRQGQCVSGEREGVVGRCGGGRRRQGEWVWGDREGGRGWGEKRRQGVCGVEGERETNRHYMIISH